MKAIYKRNGRQMDITPNEDGTWKVVDQDDSIFKISESTKKRWFKIIEGAQTADAAQEETESVVAEATAEVQEEQVQESTATVEPTATAITQEEPEQSIPNQANVVFLGDTLISEPGAARTKWEMRFDIGGVTLVVQDAASTSSSRGPARVFIQTPEGKISASTRSPEKTLVQYFGESGNDICKDVSKLRREYFKQQKGGK